MKDLKSFEKRYLTWVQPKFGVDHFELRYGEHVYAEIYWIKWFSDKALARCEDHTWTLDRLGFFRRRIVAVQAESEETSASLELGCMHEGVIHLVDASCYSWYRTKVLCNTWAVTDQDDDIMFEIEFGMRWFKHEACVFLRRTPQIHPELGLLICFAFYLGYCTMQDAAGAVAATSTAAVVG